VWFAYEPSRPVLAGLDLQARGGEILGFLGANGAGKTTTFRLLSGLLRPDAGEVEVAGVSLPQDPRGARLRSAYLPDEPLLYPTLSALENLNMFALLWGVKKEMAQERAESLLHQVDLWAVRHQWVRTYSRGMRQKLALCAALLHEPKVLLMDEPFTGLDIGAVLWARNLLHRFADAGGCVVFSSHTPEIVDSIADQIAILHCGHVAYSNSQAGTRADGGVISVYQQVCEGAIQELDAVVV
jgi:ABC-2 type transport system ATP-binding protein